jgi:hypothetical protein
MTILEAVEKLRGTVFQLRPLLDHATGEKGGALEVAAHLYRLEKEVMRPGIMRILFEHEPVIPDCRARIAIEDGGLRGYDKSALLRNWSMQRGSVLAALSVVSDEDAGRVGVTTSGERVTIPMIVAEWVKQEEQLMERFR